MFFRSCRYLLLALTISLPLSTCALINSSQHRTEDYTPLFAAAVGGDLKAVQAGVEADPNAVRAREWGGATLLHDAVGQNHLDEATYLLSKGADINAITDDGLTPLHMAAQNGNVSMIGLLLARGAQINAVDGKGWTPLDRAGKWEHPEAATYLRSRGARSGSVP